MKLCAYCGCECALEPCFCPHCGTTLSSADQGRKDASTAAMEQARNADRRLAGLLLLVKQRGFGAFLTAGLISILRSLGDPVVLVFVGLGLATITAVFWPAVLVGAAVAILIESVAFGVAWIRLRPFLDRVMKWDLVSQAAAVEDKDHTRIIAAFRLLRLVWSRVANWPVAICSALLFLLVIVAHHEYESWRRARPFRPLRTKEVAAYQQKIKILIKGDEEFQLRVCNVIKLLEDKAPGKFAYVQRHVNIIKPGVWYGYVDHFDPPVICLSNDGKCSLEWQLGTLVHEAAHVQAHRERQAGCAMVLGDVPASSNPTGNAEQDACNRIAAEALREIGAPAYEIAARAEPCDLSGMESVDALIEAATRADTNLTERARSNQNWSSSLEDRDPALWREWRTFWRGAPPAPAPKKSQLPRVAVPSDTKSNNPTGGKSP